jgi:hypothetical protein
MSSSIGRRALLKGVLAAGGAAIGSRITGPVPLAIAAPEPAHFVHIFFNGGLNALFAGNADKFTGSNLFGVTDSNVKAIGNGVVTDASTFGTFPQVALDHWAAIGMRHGSALHTTPQNLNGGGERAILKDGNDCALNKLAAAMGGDSAFKAVYFGDRPPAYREQPAFEGVSLQRITSLGDAMRTLGVEGGAAPSGANARDGFASALESSSALSKPQMARNESRLAGARDAYGSAVASLRMVRTQKLTASEIDRAYGLNGSTKIDSFAAMLAGAEVMVRAGGSNVVNVTDFGLASWDFHQVSGGKSQNGFYSRRKFLGEGAFKGNRIAALRTFLERILTLEGRNVVVAISGELVRLPNGDHGDGTVAAVFGKTMKQGVSFGVDERSRFAADTPTPKGFWAAIAAACGVPGQPFGPNPHRLVG